MNKIKLNIACGIGGFFFLAVSIAPALTIDYKYIFTAGPGQSTEFDGTSLELAVNPAPDQSRYVNVANFDFQVTGGSYLPSFSSFNFSLSPGGTYLDNLISDASPFAWAGLCYGYSGFALDGSGGSLSWMMSDSEVGFYIDGLPQVPSQYASGTWSRVPDAGSTLELLVAAMVVLGTGHWYFLGQRN